MTQITLCMAVSRTHGQHLTELTKMDGGDTKERLRMKRHLSFLVHLDDVYMGLIQALIHI